MLRRLLTLLLALLLPGAAAYSQSPARKPAARRPAAAKPVPSRRAKPKPAAPKPGVAPKPVAAPKPPPAPVDPSVAFFREGRIPRLRIEIPPGELQRLREQNREYVRCTVSEEEGLEYVHVGIHLKGAAGSFRGLDDRPALTLNFDKFTDGQLFHGLDKLHLNNSVQDPGYLDELICSELFLEAGIPAARTTHARVWMNGRDLGLYVLKEGFNRRFLKRHFAEDGGNLYEGGFVQDIDGNPKLQSGEGAVDRSDIQAVLAACRESDPALRWQKLAATVNIERFLTFMALELLTCHWDGYCENRNNYRFYFEPPGGKVQFFPHGMDQMFRNPGAGVLHTPGGMVCRAVLSNPEWRGAYRDRLDTLAARFVPPDRLLARVDAHHARVRPVLAQMHPRAAEEFDQRTRELKSRLSARAESIQRQLATPEPRALRFSQDGTAAVTGWSARKETEDARTEVVKAAGAAKECYSITAGPSGRCIASWRARVTLPAGRYRLSARARAIGVRALADGPGAGAGLRISGSSRDHRLEGDSGWTLLRYEFQVSEALREVELVAELRAAAGQVLFDSGSLQLQKLAP